MGEGHIQKFAQEIQIRLISWVLISGLILIAGYWALDEYFELAPIATLATLSVTWLILTIAIGLIIGKKIAKPTQYLAQAIMHLSPSEHLTPAPNIDDLRLGHELVSTLARQIYDYAGVADVSKPDSPDSIPAGLFDQIPVAVIGVDEDGAISLVNNKAKTTTQPEKLAGQKLNDTLHFLSDDEISIEAWLKSNGEHSVTDVKTWQKVEVKTINNVSLGYFDIAASYNKHSASGIEVLMTFYDHSDIYNAEEDSISFVSMAVHELRTPVTIMRGYIEVFEDELSSHMTPQLSDDLRKMNTSAESLSSFVSNILNVARINQGQLSLKLEENSWNVILPQIVDNLRNRAATYGKTIELRMQPDMPAVAIDRMTIGEVITNLVDNAIKYTPDDQPNISIISQVNSEGLVETTVTDKGVGIPASVMENLFTKFYRNHRNRVAIGGTGLGLFLSKAIITAHQGHIWANSKIDEGSTFGFTLLPFDRLASDQQSDNNENIVRSQHGWIKNHTMQRR